MRSFQAEADPGLSNNLDHSPVALDLNLGFTLASPDYV